MMATAKVNSNQTEWDQIISAIIVAKEPPLDYVKSVTITDKNGQKYKVTSQDFANILEREKFIEPENSDILSARFAIDITRIKRDVEKWTKNLFKSFDETGEAPSPIFTKQKKVRNSSKKSV